MVKVDMKFTSKKTEKEKVKEITERVVGKINSDLEMLKTFDENIGTGIITDGRKYLEEIMKVSYVGTDKVSMLQITEVDTQLLDKPISILELKYPTESWS